MQDVLVMTVTWYTRRQVILFFTHNVYYAKNFPLIIMSQESANVEIHILV